MDETTMQMLLRHVLEGRERIARQELLIARLEGLGNPAILTNAKRFLEDMHEHQTRVERNLADWQIRGAWQLRPRVDGGRLISP